MKNKLTKIILLTFSFSILTLIVGNIFNSQLHSLFPQLKTITSIFSTYFFKFLSSFTIFLIFLLTQMFFSKNMLTFIFQNFTVDEETINALRKIFAFLWWIFYLFIVLIIFANGITNLVTFFGLIGLGFSFVLQKPLLNVVGWFSIISKQIYKDGDRLEIYPIRGDVIRGDVINIGLFHTTLRALYKNTETLDYKTIIFPNEFVLISQIKNYSQDSNYILNEIEIALTLESNYEKAAIELKIIIENIMKKNLKAYLKRVKKEITTIEFSMKNLLGNKKNTKKKISEEIKKIIVEEKPEHIEKKKQELETKSTELEDEMKMIQELGDAYRVKVHMFAKDTYIMLQGIYITPYKLVRPTKTTIYCDFLKKIKNDESIEIAKLAYYREK